MTIRSFYHLIAIFIVFSCSGSAREQDSKALSAEQQEVSELEDQVIAIHDEVMPRMGTLVSLKDQLISKNSALETSGNQGAKDLVIINSLVIDNLDQAHESMMDWMRNFEPVDLEGDPDINKTYLQEELVKINSVKELVENAIEAAEEALAD